MDFITMHIVSKINELIKDRQKVLKHHGFIYFNDDIKFGTKKINRVNAFNLYEKEQITPISLYRPTGGVLLEVYRKLKYNDFYIYKKIEGKDCKVRLKKK